MTYEEFTELAKRKITTEEYHDLVEPVYNYHPAIPNKKTAAKLYDLCGLQVFRDMRETADRVASRPRGITSKSCILSAAQGKAQRFANTPTT